MQQGWQTPAAFAYLFCPKSLCSRYQQWWFLPGTNLAPHIRDTAQGDSMRLANCRGASYPTAWLGAVQCVCAMFAEEVFGSMTKGRMDWRILNQNIWAVGEIKGQIAVVTTKILAVKPQVSSLRAFEESVNSFCQNVHTVFRGGLSAEKAVA